MALEMKTRGGKKVAKNMNVREKTLASGMRPAHLAATIVLESWIQKNFAAEGDLHDQSKFRWPDLSDFTKSLRASVGKWPGRILQVTGRLKGGFKHTATNKGGRVVNQVAYSVIHEGGWPARNVPRRKIFPDVDQGREIVLPAYEKFIKDKVVNK